MPVKKEEVRLTMPVQKEEVEMATLKEEEIATMEAKVVDCLKPSNSVELAQPQGGLVSGTMPAPLPAYQPITFLSNPLDMAQPQGGLVSGTTPAPLPAYHFSLQTFCYGSCGACRLCSHWRSP